MQFIYNSILMYFVRLTWQIVPERVVLPLWRHLTDKVAWWPSAPAWLALYTVLVSTLYGTVVGGSQRFMGSPGDLPDTIASLHKDGHVAYSQVRPPSAAVAPPPACSPTHTLTRAPSGTGALHVCVLALQRLRRRQPRPGGSAAHALRLHRLLPPPAPRPRQRADDALLHAPRHVRGPRRFLRRRHGRCASLLPACPAAALLPLVPL